LWLTPQKLDVRYPTLVTRFPHASKAMTFDGWLHFYAPEDVRMLTILCGFNFGDDEFSISAPLSLRRQCSDQNSSVPRFQIEFSVRPVCGISFSKDKENIYIGLIRCQSLSLVCAEVVPSRPKPK
jgi:hypothetical protein